MTDNHTFPEPTRIKVNGVELDIFEAGQENAGNPIVLCHGWPELAFSWRHQMPALAAAGYHVIAPNQRGYAGSSKPADVSAYDIAHLSGDLIGLLDHFGYEDAIFVGHDWGANVVWGLTLLHPARVSKLIALSVPYQNRGTVPWADFMASYLGPDHYIVHFNRAPGVADAVFEANTAQFLRNLYRRAPKFGLSEPGMFMINLARAPEPTGTPVMSEADLAVFVEAFEASGFTPSINWYRNFNRNWHILGEVDPVIHQPALMIYGTYDMVPQNAKMPDSVPNVDVQTLPCGHWIQQELPEETTRAILNWLSKQTKDKEKPRSA